MHEAGVSVLICCHNSEPRIRQVLRHLQSQKAVDAPWEIVLVDNASTDESVSAALDEWAKKPITNLRVVRESRIGLSHARVRGLSEARYEFASFVDDDNWVDPAWVATVYAILSHEPTVGAVGGEVLPAFESIQPPWFDTFDRSFAVVKRKEPAQYLTETHEVLVGAGLSMRKAAWEWLIENGFSFRLAGRSGRKLLSSEDVELCLALKLSGWVLKYDSRLKMRHFMPEARLNWAYLRLLQRAVGYSYAFLLPYYCVANDVIGEPRRIWKRWLVHEFKRLWSYRSTYMASRLSALEGQEAVLQTERSLGLCLSLLQNHSGIVRMIDDIRNAKWRRS